MLWDNTEVENVDLEKCPACERSLPPALIGSFLRSENDLIRALEEFVEYKKFTVSLKETGCGTTLYVTCPPCSIRAKGQVPMEDETRPMTNAKPKEDTNNEDD